MRLRGPRRGWAKITLGISLLFAVGLFVVFALAGSPLRGSVGGVLIIVAGLWEWRRKRKDEIRAETLEAKAEAEQQKHRR